MSLELALLALIPPALLLMLIWKVDKLEHEPVSLIIKVLIFGGLSGLVAAVIELLLDTPISSIYYTNPTAYYIVDNFFGVAIVEEGVKMLVVMLFVWRHKEFNCLFDGVVYGATASLGFAALENVEYVVSYGFETGIVRAFTAIPGHFIFGVIMGSCIGIAKCSKYDGNQGRKALFLILALALPTFIHGYYDYLLSVPVDEAQSVWVIYMIALYVVGTIVIIQMAKHDRRINMDYGCSGETLTTPTTQQTVWPVSYRFDPYTGKPIVTVAMPATPRFDPNTGEPLSTSSSRSTGTSSDQQVFTIPKTRL